MFYSLNTATLFLGHWKRYSAEITHRWDLSGFDGHVEHPRPQYMARLAHIKKVRIDCVTNMEEPDPPFWRMKLPANVFSFSIVLLLVALAAAAVFGVVMYRMAVSVSLYMHGYTLSVMLTTTTAAFINLVLICIFNYVSAIRTRLGEVNFKTYFFHSVFLLRFIQNLRQS